MLSSSKCFLLLLLLLPVRLTTAAKWIEGYKIIPEADSEGHSFGNSIAIDDNIMVIGAYADSTKGDSAGAVYVYQRDPYRMRNWSLIKKLTASDGASGDNFGQSVAVQDNIIAVGAHACSTNSTLTKDGAVYIFDMNNNYAETKLRASDPDSNANLGFAMDLELPYLVVGAPFDDNLALDAGAVYVYKYESGAFGTPAKIFPDTVAVEDYFGYDVAISGTTFVASSTGDNDIGSASMYVLKDAATNTWELQQRVVPRSAQKNQEAGQAVAIDGDIMVMGGKRDSWNPKRWPFTLIPDGIVNRFTEYLGTVYVFERKGTEWKELCRLKPPFAPWAKNFGRALDVNDRRIIVGAPSAFRIRGTRREAGAVFVYTPVTKNMKHWARTATLRPWDVQNEDNFGTAVVFDNATIAAGASQEDQQGEAAGAAYTFLNGDMIQV